MSKHRENRVLVLTLSFGSGHVRAAQTLTAELARQLPGAEIRMLDALENCSFLFRVFYVWTYLAMIRYAPQMWRKFFQTRIDRKDEQTAPVRVWKIGCRKIFKEIKKFQPNIIVACEVGACEIAVIARRENLTNALICNVITDFEAEPIWVKPEISLYAVAVRKVAEQLESWGADSEKIRVCGIPVNRNFSEIHDLQNIKARFDLDDRPIVLLMGGGTGPTRMDEVAAQLLRNGENLQIVALAGNDRKIYYRLHELESSETVVLKILCWTEQVAELMQAAKILVTKPGGLTLSEAAVCGVPLVLFDAIPGPELSNARYFVESKAAVLTDGSQVTAEIVLDLLADSERLNAMAANSKNLARPEAAREIVVHIRNQEKVFSNAETIAPDRRTESGADLRKQIYEIGAK